MIFQKFVYIWCLLCDYYGGYSNVGVNFMTLIKVNAPGTTFEEGSQEIVLAYDMETGKYEWAREIQIKPQNSTLLILLAIIIIVMTLVIIYAMR